MEIILDNLYPEEFFNHGGVVKLTVTDDTLIKDYNLKKKYTFSEYKPYNKFFRNLYRSYRDNHTDMNNMSVHKYINGMVELNSYIGNSAYVVDVDSDYQISYETAKFHYSGDKVRQEITSKDPYGIKNVNFSLINETDDRWKEFERQRLARGFDSSELWNLDITIARFIYPRLKAFYENSRRCDTSPISMEPQEWLSVLKQMVDGFEILSSDRMKSKEDEAKETEAVNLLAKYFFALWN